jgi:hypothetical protein
MGEGHSGAPVVGDDPAALELGGGDAGRRRQSAEKAALAARRRELLLVLRKAREELGRWLAATEWEHRTKVHSTRRNYLHYLGSGRLEALCPPSITDGYA